METGKPALEAQINLAQLTKNLNAVKKTVDETVSIMAIVKANAYGHGLIPIAKHLYFRGVRHFGVARLEEALNLQKSLKKADILILSPILPENFYLAIKNKITLTITDAKDLKRLSREAKKRRQIAKIHLKIDTGLHRTGIEPEKVLDFVKATRKLSFIDIEGIFTHFANGASRPYTLKQLKIFQNILKQLGESTPKFIHTAASSTIFNYPESHFNMVRPGLFLYQNALCLTTSINRIHKLKKGDPVGYDCTFIAKKAMLVGTIMAGYGDGIRRAPKPWPYVLIGNQTAPIIGRISMDQTVIDVTQIKPRPNLTAKVTLLKPNSKVNIEEIAKSIGTNSYEVLVSLSLNRIPRSYK